MMTATIKILRCTKCGYEWYPRSPEKPKVCPRCKSYRWEKAA